MSNDDDVYISADNRAHTSAKSAIDASLEFEESSNTGSGCSQSSENIDNESDNNGDDDN